MARKTHVPIHKRPIHSAHHAVAASPAVGILLAPPVLAVNSHRHAGRPGRDGGLQRGEIARMHDRRLEPLKQPIQARIVAQEMARLFSELDIDDVVALDALGKLVADFRERNDGMAPAFVRQAVHQIDDAVFETSDAEPVDNMHDERRPVHRGFTSFTSASAASSEGRISRANCRSGSEASSGRTP